MRIIGIVMDDGWRHEAIEPFKITSTPDLKCYPRGSFVLFRHSYPPVLVHLCVWSHDSSSMFVLPSAVLLFPGCVLSVPYTSGICSLAEISPFPPGPLSSCQPVPSCCLVDARVEALRTLFLDDLLSRPLVSERPPASALCPRQHPWSSHQAAR